MGKTNGLSFCLKSFVSILLLYYVFRKVGWQELWTTLKDADLSYLPLYLGLAFLLTFVSAVKWSVLSKTHGISASLSSLFWLYMVGYFFNHILPTSVGGDVIRAYELGKLGGKRKEALASVFMERFTGFTTLIGFALLAVVIDHRFLKDIRLVAALAFALAAYLGVVGVVFNRSFLSFLRGRIPLKMLEKVLKKVEKFQDAVYMYKDHRLDILYAIGCSILFYVTSVMIVYVGCLMFHVHVPLSSLFMAVPIMLVVFMIPISVGGIGLQEWAYYFVLDLHANPPAVSPDHRGPFPHRFRNGEAKSFSNGLLQHDFGCGLEGIHLEMSHACRIRKEMNVRVPFLIILHLFQDSLGLGVVLRLDDSHECELQIRYLLLGYPIGIDHAQGVLPGIKPRHLADQRTLWIDPKSDEDFFGC